MYIYLFVLCFWNVKMFHQVPTVEIINMTCIKFRFILVGGVTPAVLPCLQNNYPQKFNPKSEIHDINIQEELPPFYSENKQTLGELLLGFLQYYAKFDYVKYVISVRVGSLLLKSEILQKSDDWIQWKLLCIEEPFEQTNTARSVYDVNVFEYIKYAFQTSFQRLITTHDISSILPKNCTDQR